jgi:hypothetical protein
MRQGLTSRQLEAGSAASGGALRIRHREGEAVSDDRNGGKPPLDEVLVALKDIYLALPHSSRSKRTIRQTNVLRRCFVILEDSGIAVPRP